jgi:glycosyltransferase involved in cell wall biosynthesis
VKTQTKKPVYVFPGPIIAPKIAEKLDRDLIGLDDDDVYNLFMFDYFSVFRRKNPLDLITAHTIAFPEETGPKLVIKTLNGDSHRSQQDQLRSAASKRSDIIILDSYISRNQLHSLINECQIYISLHRSEGYGLTLAEAMALGKPVIATGYSGNMDFMNSENSILVPYDLVPVGDDAFPYAEDARWAQPDLEFAARAIRELSLDSEKREQLGGLALSYVTSQFTMERAAEFTRLRVKNLHKKRFVHKFIKILRKLWRARKFYT